jgi:hypothetical protein
VGPDGPIETEDRERSGFAVRALSVTVVLALFFGGGFALVRYVINPHSTVQAARRPPTARPQPTDPSSSVLPSLVIQPRDTGANVRIQLLPKGDQVRGQATLDLCNAKYPSEPHRTARLQDALLDQQGNEVVSTEAVLYSSSSFTAQAFSELQSAATRCPKSPVVSPVGEPTVTTQFHAPPDTSWRAIPNVDRQAYSFTTTDQQRRSTQGIAVYLKRGRALIGIYFAQPPAAQPAIAGQTSIEGIVTVFATRLSRLPDSAIAG